MKKAVYVAFVIALLCSLFLTLYAGPVNAFSSAIQTVYAAGADSTIDGKWTTNTEWDDGMTSTITSAAGAKTGIFIDKYLLDFSAGLSVKDEYIIEAFTDKTNDTGDYTVLAYCTGSNGGTAPQSDDLKFEIDGHNGTIKTYVGTGTGWAPYNPDQLQWAQLLSVSKLNGTNPHWTTEIKVEKTTNLMQQNNYIMVGFYDASNAAAGVQTWPPNASVDVPNTYGFNDATALGTIPEGIGLAPIVVLGSIAVLIGCLYLRKQQKA